MERDEAELRAEAVAFGTYLVRRAPPPELIERYVDANRTLFTADIPGPQAAVVAFACRHGWSIALLDAAAALAPGRGAALRNKVLVMAAILEASPAFADEFLPAPVSRVGLLARLAWHGTAAVTSAVAGLLLLPLAGRSRA